ncbi:thioesterase II family protein [Bacillus cereus]
MLYIISIKEVISMGGYFEFLRKKDDAEFTLFCFPHAGGTSELYKNWDEIINENCNVCILTLPGRGRMALEKPFQDISKVLEQLSRDIESLLEKPFIFFGHSMGALISYELAKLLQKNFKKTTRSYICIKLSRSSFIK